MTLVLAYAVGAFVLGLLLWAFRCKHDWQFVDKTEFPAPIEAAKRNGVDVGWNIHSWDLPSMSKKTVVIVIRCPKCGASQVLRETH